MNLRLFGSIAIAIALSIGCKSEPKEEERAASTEPAPFGPTREITASCSATPDASIAKFMPTTASRLPIANPSRWISRTKRELDMYNTP